MLLRSASLRAIALFEALKGVVVLAAGTGLLLLVHRDVEAMAESLIGHLHLDPAARYPRIFLQLAGSATPRHLRLIALGAAVYALLRLVEAVGLWRERRWAEWMGVISAGIYLPYEVQGFVHRPGPGHAAAIIVNLAIILFLAVQLRSRRALIAPSRPVDVG
jgi:uncharacterized membrane protein (DUF2068 family)